MAKLTPFRALRPTPLGRTAGLLRALRRRQHRGGAGARRSGIPLSFLHVTRSEIDLPDEHRSAFRRGLRPGANGISRPCGARRRSQVEAEPALYLYRLKMGDHVQTGVAGTWSVDEYENDLIKKHEKTRRDKEDDRTHHMCALRAQTGKVFLTYKASVKVDAIVDAGGSHGAAVRLHRGRWRGAYGLARVKPQIGTRWSQRSPQIPELYIADGHHRAASAWRTRTEIAAGRSPHAASPSAGSADNFLAVAFPDDQVQVLPYHRLVKDLHGRVRRQPAR